MSSVFTKIINGDIPGRFIWSDDLAVAFLTVAPITPGHTLVVPRVEIDQWVDLDPELMGHLSAIGQIIGRAQKAEWDAPRAGLIVAGLEVPHTHLHVLPMWAEGDLSFAKADAGAPPERLDQDAARLRARLAAQGHGDRIPA